MLGRSSTAVGRVVDAIGGRDIPKFERIHALNAGHVHRELVRVRPSFMVRIDPADRAEIVFGSFGVELVETNTIGAAQNGKSFQGDRGDNSAPAHAHRTVATTQIFKTIGQRNLELNTPAMTSSSI